jgi:hypothetical protein
VSRARPFVIGQHRPSSVSHHWDARMRPCCRRRRAMPRPTRVHIARLAPSPLVFVLPPPCFFLLVCGNARCTPAREQGRFDEKGSIVSRGARQLIASANVPSAHQPVRSQFGPQGHGQRLAPAIGVLAPLMWSRAWSRRSCPPITSGAHLPRAWQMRPAVWAVHIPVRPAQPQPGAWGSGPAPGVLQRLLQSALILTETSSLSCACRCSSQ